MQHVTINHAKRAKHVNTDWLYITVNQCRVKIKLTHLKEALSQKCCHMLIETAQIFDKEPLLLHEIALRTQGEKYEKKN